MKAFQYILMLYDFQDTMEKAIKNKVAKAVVPAIDAMFQALRFVIFVYLLISY